MAQLQVQRDAIDKARLVEASKPSIDDGEVLLKIDHFGFTANNITYAHVGERIGYWRFFPPSEGGDAGWGVIPVWGFADVVESNAEGLPVGERLYGYFPPATHLKILPQKISERVVFDGSPHRAELPMVYNRYTRVLAEPGYDRANDAARMLLAPLFITSFCLWDDLSMNDWYGARQVLIASASSKTSIGLAYALNRDANAPRVVGLTSPSNTGFVEGLGYYDETVAYDALDQLDPSVPTAIVDMSGNAELLARLHRMLGDNMKKTVRVGLTHWDADAPSDGLIEARTHFFFAPAHVEMRFKDWGPAEFDKKSNGFFMEAAAAARDWMSVKTLDGLEGLRAAYEDVCAGRIAPNEALIVKL